MWTLHWIRERLHNCHIPDACSSTGIGSKRFGVTCLSMCKTGDDSVPVGGGGGGGEQNTAAQQRPGLASKCSAWLCAPSGDGKRCKPKCHCWKSVCTKVFLIVVNFSFLVSRPIHCSSHFYFTLVILLIISHNFRYGIVYLNLCYLPWFSLYFHLNYY